MSGSVILPSEIEVLGERLDCCLEFLDGITDIFRGGSSREVVHHLEPRVALIVHPHEAPDLGAVVVVDRFQ